MELKKDPHNARGDRVVAGGGVGNKISEPMFGPHRDECLPVECRVSGGGRVNRGSGPLVPQGVSDPCNRLCGRGTG